MASIVADLGNSRLKAARLLDDGSLDAPTALDVENLDQWPRALDAAGLLDDAARPWRVSTVRPSAADALARLLAERRVSEITWYRSAADVPIRHALREPSRTGADRALAVRAALHLVGGGPLAVVLVGTAVTVERVDADGCWLGGAIAPGLRPMADALHRLTAQLPRVDVAPDAPAWSDGTEGAIAAGLRWGLVGSVRELLARQAFACDPPVIFAGGDAAWLAESIRPARAIVEPDLVLRGLADLASDRDPS